MDKETQSKGAEMEKRELQTKWQIWFELTNDQGERYMQAGRVFKYRERAEAAAKKNPMRSEVRPKQTTY